MSLTAPLLTSWLLKRSDDGQALVQHVIIVQSATQIPIRILPADLPRRSFLSGHYDIFGLGLSCLPALNHIDELLDDDFQHMLFLNSDEADM